MNTNHDALREALEPFAAIDLTQSGVPANFAELVLRARIALSQPMLEVAAQGRQGGLSNAELLTHWRKKVRRPSGPTGQELSAFALGVEVGVSLSAPPAAPEGAKPLPTMVDKKSTNPQPQAQGKPEVVAWSYNQDPWGANTVDVVFADPNDNRYTPLITLQSHREAIIELHTEIGNQARKCSEYREALAKHRAALEAERNRLDFLAQTQSYIEWNLAGDCCRVVPPNGFSHWFDTPRAAIDAAITHANQVLEGGGK